MARPDRRPRNERGAVAILVAVLSIVLFMSAALAVDISKQVNEKHTLQNQLDAAAVAAGYYLQSQSTGCDPAQPAKSCLASAVANAQDYYKRNYGRDLNVAKIDFWCVVARRQTTTAPQSPTSPGQAALFQIATTSYGAGVCNPDAVSGDTTCATGKTCFQMPNYQGRVRTWDSTRFNMTCSDQICAIPCGLKASAANNWAAGTSSLNSQDVTCNTIRVASEVGVPFSFAPAGGIDSGSTGNQVSVACRGSCGTIAVNPMDVVVVADRTPSMSTTDRRDMVDGIRSMLGVMTPAQQFVSIGTIARSSTTNRSTSACPSSYNTSAGGSISGSGGLTFPSTSLTSGQWVPLKFYDDYLTSAGTLNNNSNVAKALTCIYNGNSYEGGTSLAAPLKAASRYVLGSPYETNNVQSELSGSDRVGDIRKVVIFETDGQPQEWGTNSNVTSLTSNTDPMARWDAYSSSTANTSSNQNRTDVAASSLGVSPTPATSYRQNRTRYDIQYNQALTTRDQRTTSTTYGGQQACKNFQDVATAAKSAGVLIITMGYNLNGSKMCGDNNTSGPGNSQESQTTGYVSNIQPTTGSTWYPSAADCRSGSGTASRPYVLNTEDCRTNVTVTYTSTTTLTGDITVDRGDDQRVTDVLASAAGGTDVPPSASNGCADDNARAAENGDGDFFFCAASGDDMGPIFQTALSQVSTGVKLLSGLPG